MNIKITSAATAVATVLLTTSSFAEDRAFGDFYGQVFGGANILQDLDFAGQIGGAPQSVANDFDTGYNIGVAFGTYLPAISNSTFGARGELELSYRENDVSSVNFSGNGPAAEGNVSGGSSSTTIFANLLFDIKTANKRLSPYVGAGLGVAFTDQSIVYGPGVRIDDSDNVFAAQLIAGVAYELTDNLALTLDGRYSRAFNVSSTRLNGAGALTGIVEDDVDNLSVNVGLRFEF